MTKDLVITILNQHFFVQTPTRPPQPVLPRESSEANLRTVASSLYKNTNWLCAARRISRTVTGNGNPCVVASVPRRMISLVDRVLTGFNASCLSSPRRTQYSSRRP